MVWWKHILSTIHSWWPIHNKTVVSWLNDSFGGRPRTNFNHNTEFLVQLNLCFIFYHLYYKIQETMSTFPCSQPLPFNWSLLNFTTLFNCCASKFHSLIFFKLTKINQTNLPLLNSCPSQTKIKTLICNH